MEQVHIIGIDLTKLRNPDIGWLGVNSPKPDSGSRVRDMSEPSKGDKLFLF